MGILGKDPMLLTNKLKNIRKINITPSFVTELLYSYWWLEIREGIPGRHWGAANITCRRARKGFNVRLNVDSHWSAAFYKGLDTIQLEDGRDKTIVNGDDAAGFRLDTFTHKQHKSI